ncbi:MAG: hypothetical protein WC346_09535 [Methanogenium sp.]|jgi:predicted phage tail protein
MPNLDGKQGEEKVMTENYTFMVDDIQNIHGSGGGKGAGSGSDTPTEVPDNLVSNSIATVIDLVSEGQIEGLVTDEDSIYFDEIPLYDYDADVYNFEGVSIATINGSEYSTQQYIPGITDETPTEYTIAGNQKVTASGGAPSPQNINITTDDLRVSLYVTTFRLVSNTTGDIKNTTASCKVQIKPDGGAWQDAATVIFTGKRSSGAYVKSVELMTYQGLALALGKFRLLEYQEIQIVLIYKMIHFGYLIQK